MGSRTHTSSGPAPAPRLFVGRHWTGSTVEPAGAVAQPEARSVQPAEPLLDSAGAVLVHRGARAAPGQPRGPPADSWWSGTACREERPWQDKGRPRRPWDVLGEPHRASTSTESFSPQRSKELSSSSICPKAAVCPPGIQGTRCSSPHGSDLHLLLDEVEPPFLFSFLKRGSGGCSRSHP